MAVCVYALWSVPTLSNRTLCLSHRMPLTRETSFRIRWMTWRAISARRYAKESSSDWAVMMTRTGAYAMIPIFYCLERLTRSDGHTPYFQALAAVYAVGVAGVATSSVGREPYMGSTAQLAVPIRERLIYTMFWVVVLGVKLAFGHWLLVTPLREAIMVERCRLTLSNPS